MVKFVIDNLGSTEIETNYEGQVAGKNSKGEKNAGFHSMLNTRLQKCKKSRPKGDGNCNPKDHTLEKRVEYCKAVNNHNF
ncbi:MAG: hypothetical protein NTW31_06255 [Bacteroidetes bacterium]|nr:hypothetical protein [Bacteroidota bacterium]